jgi:5-(carboxyamino)imidazole ribonucleotide mutase
MTYKVAILMGSPNDMDKMRPAADTLERFGIEADVRVASAHRNPAVVTALAASAREEGYAAFIGVDALYSTVQMPKGIPVATVAVDGSMNAALLVVEMLAITDADLAKQLADHRIEIAG